MSAVCHFKLRFVHVYLIYKLAIKQANSPGSDHSSPELDDFKDVRYFIPLAKSVFITKLTILD